MTKIYNHITEDEKIKLARITQDCLDTHVMQPPKGKIRLSVFDANGVELERHETLSKSWTRNFYNQLFFLGTTYNLNGLGLTYGAGYLARKETDASIPTQGTPRMTIDDLVGGSGANNKGIVIGTSNSAESFESYILGAIIANGSGAGQMSYAAQDATTVSYNAGTKTMTGTLRRYFNNNSGAAIVVKECGLIYYEADYANKFLINRDVLPTPVTVPNGGQLKVDYVIELVYPA